ncbi:hypothetical protein EDEG_00467 [Edhazardia aedis USNM 41457]|uniref:Cullin family profile domain-containing protein n=1 Tax=Edhazardia aedis (strain USNM 41457) TaxID=1003232 RepID=J9DIY2_EDHAE|nr:hypothetical protein EDEG_00467 [Edhazardia aedis USNM 41457]|eukprot:EJW01342.1 hypothetical protein EDEG_00467 [Edhazardia aedis USNM 41457]
MPNKKKQLDSQGSIAYYTVLKKSLLIRQYHQSRRFAKIILKYIERFIDESFTSRFKNENQDLKGLIFIISQIKKMHNIISQVFYPIFYEYDRYRSDVLLMDNNEEDKDVLTYFFYMYTKKLFNENCDKIKKSIEAAIYLRKKQISAVNDLKTICQIIKEIKETEIYFPFLKITLISALKNDWEYLTSDINNLEIFDSLFDFLGSERSLIFDDRICVESQISFLQEICDDRFFKAPNDILKYFDKLPKMVAVFIAAERSNVILNASKNLVDFIEQSYISQDYGCILYECFRFVRSFLRILLFYSSESPEFVVFYENQMRYFINEYCDYLDNIINKNLHEQIILNEFTYSKLNDCKKGEIISGHLNYEIDNIPGTKLNDSESRYVNLESDPKQNNKKLTTRKSAKKRKFSISRIYTQKKPKNQQEKTTANSSLNNIAIKKEIVSTTEAKNSQEENNPNNSISLVSVNLSQCTQSGDKSDEGKTSINDQNFNSNESILTESSTIITQTKTINNYYQNEEKTTYAYNYLKQNFESILRGENISDNKQTIFIDDISEYFQFSNRKDQFIKIYCNFLITRLLMFKTTVETEFKMIDFLRKNIPYIYLHKIIMLLKDYNSKTIFEGHEFRILNHLRWSKIAEDNNYKPQIILKNMQNKFQKNLDVSSKFLNYSWLNSVSTCIIEINSIKTTMTVTQYHILKTIDGKKMKEEEISKIVKTKNFSLNFRMLLKYNLILEENSFFYVNHQITILPTSLCPSELLFVSDKIFIKEECENEKQHDKNQYIDSLIMRKLKECKSIKEKMLHQYIYKQARGTKAALINSRLKYLCDSEFLEISNNTIKYVP